MGIPKKMWLDGVKQQLKNFGLYQEDYTNRISGERKLSDNWLICKNGY